MAVNQTKREYSTLMEMDITRQFSIISIHPVKGWIMPGHENFKFALSGAFILDFFLKGEIRFEDNRIVPSTRNTGDQLHDRLADLFSSASGPRKISYWIRKFQWRWRTNMNEAVDPFITSGVLTHEVKHFLGIIPYHRYYIIDQEIRNPLIRSLRNVLISGSTPTKEQKIVIGLLREARILRHLASDRSERSIIRSRYREIFSNEDYPSETDIFIRKVLYAVRQAIVASESAHGA